MYSVFDLDEYFKMYNLLGENYYDFDINDENIYANNVDLSILKETIEFVNLPDLEALKVPVGHVHYIDENRIISTVISSRIELYTPDTIHKFILENFMCKRLYIYSMKFYKENVNGIIIPNLMIRYGKIH